MVNMKTIQSFLKASGVKSILQTKPQSLKGLNSAQFKFVPNLEGDIINFKETTELFYKRNKDKLKKINY